MDSNPRSLFTAQSVFSQQLRCQEVETGQFEPLSSQRGTESSNPSSSSTSPRRCLPGLRKGPAPAGSVSLDETRERDVPVSPLSTLRWLRRAMPDFRYRQTTATLDVRGFAFRAAGRQPIDLGWRAAFPDWQAADEKGDDAQWSVCLLRLGWAGLC